jgi:sigma-B regulation protein RsbU (phosphoserine phosphatase)
VRGRIARSLRLRLLAATLALVAGALLLAAFGFDRVARGVVEHAVQDHLQARSREVHEAVLRFQRERALTVRSWAESEAMQLTLDSGDPKFVEDFLRRLIQDQGGSIAAVALVGTDGKMLAGVRSAEQGERRGAALTSQHGRLLKLPVVIQALAAAPDAIDLGTLRQLDEEAGEKAGEEPVVLVASPVRDFTNDVVGAVVAAISTQAMRRLLEEIGGSDGDLVPVVYDGRGTLVLVPPGVDQRLVDPVVAVTAVPGTLERTVPRGAGTLLSVRTGAGLLEPNWTAAMVEPEASAYGQLGSLRLLLAVLFLAVLTGAGLASIGALRAASRPLSEVTGSMARVAQGDLTTRIPGNYSDELGALVGSFNTMVAEVAHSHDELQRTEALRKEVQIAHRIQTAILPNSPAVIGYEVAARMKPAEDVGGDLYDILSFPETFWVMVGDVSGHGINSGLVMMMAQAAAYGTIADDPNRDPRDVVSAVNRVVHENVRQRMGRDDYLTLMAARHMGDGRFMAAGAHQPIFIARCGGTVEVIEPSGPWVGLTADLSTQIVPYEFHLGPGDAVCFITDGVVEAQDSEGALFGEDRLAELLRAEHPASAAEILTQVFQEVEAHAASQADDITVVVLRRKTHDD